MLHLKYGPHLLRVQYPEMHLEEQTNGSHVGFSQYDDAEGATSIDGEEDRVAEVDVMEFDGDGERQARLSNLHNCSERSILFTKITPETTSALFFGRCNNL